MTEKKENVQLDKNIDPKEREKLESVRKADAAVKTMQDFTSPEVLYQELIASVRKYHPSTDISMIQKAYEVASDAHKDQKRKSGEPYIIHPLCVAIILAVPLLLYSPKLKISGNLPESDSFADIGATIASNFGVAMPEGTIGTPMKEILD